MGGLLDHGMRKYVGGTVVRSSKSCQWSGVAAEHRRLPAVVLPPIEMRQMEVCIATHRERSVVIRRAGGQVQRSESEPGMIWLCPVGVREDEVVVQSPMELLHIYLPPARFDQLSEASGGRPISAASVQYLAGIRDDLIRQIGDTIHAEMRKETSSGRLLVDCLAMSLAARLVQAYSADGQRAASLYTPHTLDRIRLARVLEYIDAHLENDLGVDELAEIACLSPFHFARMFRNSMGVPPHRYLSDLRIARAKSLLADTDRPLVDIALASCFSSQANFTRAFRQATGQSPGAYRRASR